MVLNLNFHPQPERRNKGTMIFLFKEKTNWGDPILSLGNEIAQWQQERLHESVQVRSGSSHMQSQDLGS